jgi:hypothetical protein
MTGDWEDAIPRAQDLILSSLAQEETLYPLQPVLASLDTNHRATSASPTVEIVWFMGLSNVMMEPIMDAFLIALDQIKTTHALQEALPLPLCVRASLSFGFKGLSVFLFAWMALWQEMSFAMMEQVEDARMIVLGLMMGTNAQEEAQ